MLVNVSVIMTNLHSYKTVDQWLGNQSYDVPSAWTRLKWSGIYLRDAAVEIFNHLQRAAFNDWYSQGVSRLLAAMIVVGPLFALAAL